MSVTHLIDTRDCTVAGCPNEADRPDGLCSYCRRWRDTFPGLQLVHSRRETPVGAPVCKACNNQTLEAMDRRGIYAGLCPTCKEAKKSARINVPVERRIEATPEPEHEAGPLLRELIDAQPAYELAQEAAATVKARMQTYGPPDVNHGCTAELWSTWLNRRFGVRLELTAADVCWLNVLQKLSREANLPTGDNRLDVMGFAINAELAIRAPEAT